MGMHYRVLSVILAVFLVSGCATVSEKAEPTEAPVVKEKQVEAQKSLQVPVVKRYKTKIAIARFTNETNYGRSLMTDADLDRIGKQASDMLASRLIKSEKFLVFERTDLQKVKAEQIITGDAKLIGVDTLIIGSVSEFGRSVSGKSGFLSSTKVQTARAKVDIRLVDVHTGYSIFSTTGAGEASMESGEIAGYGSHAEYDATLNDRAIAAAISDVIDKLVSTLDDRPWRTDIIEIQGRNVYISGGVKQGLKAGDTLRVMEAGKKVSSTQTGFDIALPPTKIATLRVVSLFGDSEINEGSVCEITSGAVDKSAIRKVFVEEVKQ